MSHPTVRFDLVPTSSSRFLLAHSTQRTRRCGRKSPLERYLEQLAAPSLILPIFIVKVRFQAVGPGKPARYKNTFQAFSAIVRQEGVRGLWTGVGPTVQRAAILTATQIPSYDHVKHTLINHEIMKEGPSLHVVSSFAAGLFTACTTSPVDVVKTRIMNQEKDHLGRPKVYEGIFDCFTKILRHEIHPELDANRSTYCCDFFCL